MGSGTLATLERPKAAPKAPVLAYSRERIGDVLDRADVLGREHWRELYGETPYVADLDRIAAIKDFAYFVARAPSGAIVGHAGFFLIDSPFHGCWLATDAFYYVQPRHRRHGAAAGLLRFAAIDLQASGIAAVMVSRMAGTSLGGVLESAGYRISSHNYRFEGA